MKEREKERNIVKERDIDRERQDKSTCQNLIQQEGFAATGPLFGYTNNPVGEAKIK